MSAHAHTNACRQRVGSTDDEVPPRRTRRSLRATRAEICPPVSAALGLHASCARSCRRGPGDTMRSSRVPIHFFTVLTMTVTISFEYPQTNKCLAKGTPALPIYDQSRSPAEGQRRARHSQRQTRRGEGSHNMVRLGESWYEVASLGLTQTYFENAFYPLA
jgi:hypothetical protein